MAKTPVQDMVDGLFKKVRDRYTEKGLALISSEVHEALINSELLILCSAQDSSTSSDTVRRVMDEGRSEIIDRFYGGD